MVNAEHSRLASKLNLLKDRVTRLIVSISFEKEWMCMNNREDHYHEWIQHFNTYNIYRSIMNDLTDEIRAIKQEIKKVNGKNL